MVAQDIISDVKQRGISLELIEGKIRLHGTEEALDQDVASLVKTHKAEIIAHLSRVEKPEIVIQRMDVCLHGARCRFISLADDRQICSKNNQTIFDMDACPDGRWWKAKAVDSVEASTVQPTACYACGNKTFWRKKDNRAGRWICDVCHPPVLSKGEIEWLQ